MQSAPGLFWFLTSSCNGSIRICRATWYSKVKVAVTFAGFFLLASRFWEDACLSPCFMCKINQHVPIFMVRMFTVVTKMAVCLLSRCSNLFSLIFWPNLRSFHTVFHQYLLLYNYYPFYAFVFINIIRFFAKFWTFLGSGIQVAFHQYGA